MRSTSGKTDDPGRPASRPLAVGRRVLAWPLAGLMLALAAPAQADTLSNALAKTYETNPSLAAARAALRATNERVPQALANWGPVGRVVGVIGAGTEERPGGVGRSASGQGDFPRRDEFNRETAR